MSIVFLGNNFTDTDQITKQLQSNAVQIV